MIELIEIKVVCKHYYFDSCQFLKHYSVLVEVTIQPFKVITTPRAIKMSVIVPSSLPASDLIEFFRNCTQWIAKKKLPPMRIELRTSFVFWSDARLSELTLYSLED